ncbi:MAG: hypothetical protein IJJ20_03370 [Thermoguttaceae bacterium]|nr:hypothetical protein [Thermoguttaceae bacterium]
MTNTQNTIMNTVNQMTTDGKLVVAAIASAVLNTQRTAEAKKAKKPRKEGKSK